MLGRLIGLGLILAALAVGASEPAAAAEWAPGPRLATVELLEGEGALRHDGKLVPTFAVAAVDPATGEATRLLRSGQEPRRRVAVDPVPPAWSADGSLIAFSGRKGRSDKKGRLFVVGPDGTGLRALPGTTGASNPVFSPDGRTLAFSRLRFGIHIARDFSTNPTKDGFQVYLSVSTWVVDLAGGGPRQLTPWRNGLSNIPTSFAPDGSGLLITEEDDKRSIPRVVWKSLVDGTSRPLLPRAKEAVYSPDGSRIAFTGYLHPDRIRVWRKRSYPAGELYVANADGTGVTRLSRSKGVLETSPSWDPSGQRIAYVRFKGDTSVFAGLVLLFPLGNSLMQVNADGSCRGKIASAPKTAHYGVAWQPGAGREAGPLSC